MNRRGFTLIELMVAAVLMGLVAVSLTRMLMSNSRFAARQNAMLDARQTARAALNTMASELRMVSDSGLLAASAKSVTVRVPYAFGMACETVGGSLIASLMPPDSLLYAKAVPYGIAWRDSTNRYSHFTTNLTVTSSASTSSCSIDSIRVVPGGKLVSIKASPSSQPLPSPGDIFYLYQRITYSFVTSTTLAPGRKALQRAVQGGSTDELSAPFDTSAGFQFDTGGSFAVVSAVPANLTRVRGLYLTLTGASDSTPIGASAPSKFDLRTNILFMNRRYP